MVNEGKWIALIGLRFWRSLLPYKYEYHFTFGTTIIINTWLETETAAMTIFSLEYRYEYLGCPARYIRISDALYMWYIRTKYQYQQFSFGPIRFGELIL